MRKPIAAAGLLCALVLLEACASRPDGPPRRREAVWHPPVGMLLPYVGPDGRLTRALMEAGLRKDFAATDKNHTGVLEPDEARAVNQQRWQEDKSAISPLQDWNGDGVIDFGEFAATPRALFNELDQDHNGILTPDELHAGGGGPKDGPQDQGGQPQRGGRGGPGGPGGGGPGG